MEFTCKYRDSSGVIRNMSISASNRAEIFEILKAKGVAPISITKETEKKSGKTKQCVSLRTGILIAVMVLCVGIVTLLLPKHNERRIKKNDKAKIIRRTDSVTMKPQVARTPVQPPKKLMRPPKTRENRIVEKSDQSVISVVTNSSGFILSTIIDENGKTNIITETVEPQTFKNPMLQLIAAAIGGSYDSELAPLPPVGPEGVKQLRDALKVEIPDFPDDTEMISRIKDAVRRTRKEMVNLIDEGVSIGEIFTQHQEVWNENVKIRREIKQEYIDTLSNGDTKGATEYLHKVNGIFREMGIPELSESEIAATERKGKMK